MKMNMNGALRGLTRGKWLAVEALEGAGSGSLEARGSAAGATFYWRGRDADGKTLRIGIGAYDGAAAPASVNPTKRGYSLTAAKRRAQEIAAERAQAKASHVTLRGEQVRQREEARAAEEAMMVEARARDAAARREATTVARAWGAYLSARRPRWGARHAADHVALARAGGEDATRGTRGRGKTVAAPLHPFMAMQLQDLTAPVVEAWAAREGKARPTTARLAWRLLRAFLSWCAEHPDYSAMVPDQNPAKSRRAREALGKAGAKKDALLKEQLPAWFAAVLGIGNAAQAAYLQALLLTGARPGELLGLRWGDVNAQWRGLTIRDKVEGERTIPLTPYVHQLLAALPRRSVFVFHGVSAKGAPQPMSIPRKGMGVACAVAGVEGLTLHGLRRSFKSLSEWLDMPAGVIAQIQGHKPSATAEKHYTVRPLDLLRMHHERLEGWILEQAGVQFTPRAEPGKLKAVA